MIYYKTVIQESRTQLYCKAVVYYIVLDYVLVYHMPILFRIMVCYSIAYYISLYCNILYCTILYIVLHYMTYSNTTAYDVVQCDEMCGYIHVYAYMCIYIYIMRKSSTDSRHLVQPTSSAPSSKEPPPAEAAAEPMEPAPAPEEASVLCR